MKKKPTVKLLGTDGNAFSILGKVSNALRNTGQGEKVEQYMKEAMAGDYDNLLRVTMQYVNVK